MSYNQLFVLPFIGHFILIICLYIYLTYLRKLAVRNKEIEISNYAEANADTPISKFVARNLSNQFELPIYAYLAATIIYMFNLINLFDLIAAWLFFIGRLIHSYVQIKTRNVALRGYVFTINFIGIIMLVFHVFSIPFTNNFN